MRICWYVFSLVATSFKFCGGFRWFASAPFKQTVWANDSGPAVFQWDYETTNSDFQPLDIRIKCGYFEKTDLKPLVNRYTHQSEISVQRDSIFQLDPFPGSNAQLTIGFRIKSVKKTDPKSYGCRAYVKQKDERAGIEFNSQPSSLQVWDRPEFVDCLRNLPSVQSASNLDITCKVVGNPQPILKCELFSYNGVYLKRLGSDSSRANITNKFFEDIAPEARTITCTAWTKETGSVNLTQSIVVNHPPFAPREFYATPRTRTSFELKWRQIPRNETGGDFTDYTLEYLITRIGEVNKTSVKLPDKPTEDGFVTFILEGLVLGEKYTLRIYGNNRYGEGPKSVIEETAKAPPVTENSTGSRETAIIIGSVVAGLVVIVVIVIIIVYCCRRSDKNKRYPTSYVEDAVDYPMQQGGNMYMKVNKKNKGVSRSDSTSGYPDVVTAAENGHRGKNTSSSYEDSSKAYV